MYMVIVGTNVVPGPPGHFVIRWTFSSRAPSDPGLTSCPGGICETRSSAGRQQYYWNKDI
jgi:hypothetical protein